MATLNYNIRERVKLEGRERGTSFEVTLPSASYHDERILNISSGSFTDIVDFSGTEGAGQFISSSLLYFRFTNHSTGSVVLQLSSSNETFNMIVGASGSFMYDNTFLTGSFTDVSTDSFDNIVKIKAQPVDLVSTVEYFLVSK
jgi:hypothetical protein|tara:strand:- start:168 stop:596 length:429 start_codon:yes stop_codon:yes gene_type:complete